MSEKIIEKLEQMDGKLDKLLTWKEVHKAEHKTIYRDVEEMRGVLFENPGLKAQVQSLMNCKRNISRWREFWLGVLKTVVAAAIISIVLWLMMIYKKG